MTDTPTSAEALDRLMSLNAQAARDDMIEIDRLRTALDAAEAREQAAVAAALRQAARYHDDFLMTKTSLDVEAVVSSTEAILALIPDTGSALDRMLDEARREEREACAIIAAEWEETFEKRDEEERSVGAGRVFRDIRARGEGA